MAHDVKQVFVHSIGTAVPAYRISQSDHHRILENANGLSREEKLKMRMYYLRSGIEYRHSVLPEFSSESESNKIFHPSNHHPVLGLSRRMDIFEKAATELCVSASRKSIGDSGMQPEQITHLVTFSCTGMSAPGLDISLVSALGLNTNVERTCINFMGCYAAINAVRTAAQVVRADPAAVVLIAGVELCTLHYQNAGSDDQMLANALFADGAASAIISSRVPENQPAYSLGPFLSSLNFPARREMVWKIGETAFDLRLSAYIPNIIEENIAAVFEMLLKKAGWTSADIRHFAIHPGGIRILQACEQALGIKAGQIGSSYKVLKNFGNMSSVTVLFVLQDLLTSAKEGKVFSCAFGPGLTTESMLLEIQQ